MATRRAMFEIDGTALPAGTDTKNLEGLATLLEPHSVTLDRTYGPIPIKRPDGKTYQLYRGTYEEAKLADIHALPYLKRIWSDPRAGPTEWFATPNRGPEF